MDGTRLLPVVYTRCLVIPALADIERNGLHLDAERVEEAYRVAVDKYTKAMAEMDELTGGINPRSPTQVAHFVYGKLGFEELKDKQGNPIRNKPSKQFPDGVPKCDETTLLSLRASTPEQTRFIELKKEVGKLSSLLDKNLSMFLGACRETEATIYGEVNQGRTVTHRTSSAGKPTKYEMFDKAKGCQFQNLPRKCKPLFSARRDGWVIAEADAPQLEFRVAGFLGNDETIIREVTEGYDVHTYTKDVISKAGGVAISRTEAKKHTFKPLYGGSSGTDAERAYYQAFNEKYHRLVEKQTDWCLEVEATKQLVTPWGFVFYWPNAKSLPIIRFNPETKRREEVGRYLNVRTNVVNAPIQSLATADIIPITLAYFWHRTRSEDWIMITNTIHDSIISEINPESRELFQNIVVKAFTDDVYGYLAKVYDMKFNVPLGVGIKIGTHWGELPEGEEEISVQVQPPA